MKKFQNVSPIGALDIPALNRVVEAGEKFDVPDDLVEYFDSQPSNFAEVTASKPSRGRGKSKAADADESAEGTEPHGDIHETGQEPAEDETSNDEEEAGR